MSEQPIKIIDFSNVPEDFFNPRKISLSVRETVASVLEDVQNRGDAALRDMSGKFDHILPSAFEIPADALRVCAENMKKTRPDLYDAVSYSFDLALRFAEKQRECFTDFETELEPGIITGQKNIPVERAGLYVPAGRFPLFSSLVMSAAPAKAAGVSELILCTPPRLHEKTAAAANPSVCEPWADKGILAAAYICGVNKVFAVGGAQAVGAMAFGTESVPRCDVIVGPGNKYVAEAKRLVFGQAGIDFVAGPTEAFIIADDSARPDWVAADMLAQSEHDTDAQAVLVTCSRALAEQTAAEIKRQLETLPTAATARASLERSGIIIIADSIEQAAEIANKKAPEHLELAMDDSPERRKLLELTHNYGTLFIGHDAAEVFGDYTAGLNHILPTSASARFTGGLSVRMFLKTTTTLRTQRESADGSTAAGFEKSAGNAAVLGDAEGLAAHARAARIRLE